MTTYTAEQWADEVEAIMGGNPHTTPGNGYDWDTYSLAYAAGSIAGVSIDVEADDNLGRRLTSDDHTMVIEYDERSGHWYAR